MRLLDSSLLRRTLRGSSSLLANALHVQALTLAELGKLAESLAELLGERGTSQSPPKTASNPAPAAHQPPPEDDKCAGDATPRAVGREPTASAFPSPTEPVTGQKRATSGATLSAETAVQAGSSPVAPAHVDEEAVLVAESADQGAEEGAGATVHVEEPWSGYRLMRAREIVDHLPAVSEEALTLVLLYEPRAGRKRSSVIRAAERELSRRSAGDR